MSSSKPDSTVSELERLYRQAGDVEPSAGLDRTLLARAGQSPDAAPARRSPWLAGAVTASVAVIAIVLVVRQVPPTAPVPVAPNPSSAPTRQSAPEAEPQTPGAAARALREVSPAPRAAPAEEDTASRSPERAAAVADRAAPEARRQRGAAAAQFMPEDAGMRSKPIVPPGAGPGAAALQPPEAVIAEIRRRLEAGETEAARALAAELAAAHPNREWPEDIGALLEAPPDPRSP